MSNTYAVSGSSAKRDESIRMSPNTFIRLETFRFERMGIAKIIFVPVQCVNLHGNGSPGRDFVSPQLKILDDVPNYVRHGRI